MLSMNCWPGKKVTRATTDPAGCYIGRVAACHGGGQSDVYQGRRPGLQSNIASSAIAPGRWDRSRSPPTTKRSAGPKRSRRWFRSGGCLPGTPIPSTVIFRTTPGSSDAEKELIYTWVGEGCPPGNPADMPEPPKFAEGWRIPKPDVVLKMPEPFEMPDRGTVPYQEIRTELRHARGALDSGRGAAAGQSRR